jgi:hypothetical protein
MNRDLCAGSTLLAQNPAEGPALQSVDQQDAAAAAFIAVVR